MISKFKNKCISSVLTVLPANEVNFMDEMSNYSFSESQMKKLKRVMGFNTRRVAIPGETVSEYAIYGIKKMIADGVFKEDEIGGIIVTTSSPDYFVPPISNIVQGAFNFSHDSVCIDISQGCCGFTVGLIYSMMTLESLGDKKILLITGGMDTFHISKRDRASRPIAGDAVAITVVENTKDENVIYTSMKNNGKDAFAVYIPAGGNKTPITPETTVEKPDEFGNWRGLQHLVMQGDLVFNFISNDTPIMVEELLDYAGEKVEDVDYFICHQSSMFTLKKLAQRLGVTQDRLPNDIVPLYGNSSSSTIPVTICQHYNEMFKEKEKLHVMFTAFGTGLSLGAVLMDVPKLQYCQFIDYPHKTNEN